jgi:hypothetical protein
MPQFWKGEGRNGFRVRYAVKNNEFINERPFAVLEGALTGAAMVTIELDPAKLRPTDPGGSVYEYADPIIDPR